MPTSYFITYKKQTGELVSVISSYHPVIFLLTPSSPCLKELAQQGEAFLVVSEEEIKIYSEHKQLFEKNYLEQDEIKIFEQVCQGRRYCDLFLLLLYSGITIKEG